MAETLTLSELKARNASDQEEVKLDTDETVEEVETEEVDELEGEDTETDDTEETEESDEELEDWQKSGEEDSEDGKKPAIDNQGWKAQRLKTKALKDENREQADELEELKAKVAVLSNQQGQPVVDLKRPTLEDADFDEDKHAELMDKYIDAKINSKLNTNNQNAQQTQQQQKALQKQVEAVDSHYERAAELVSSGKVDGKKYADGDSAIVQTLDGVFPNVEGRVLADQLIALMDQSGEGSEKAWYFLGNNKAARETLKEKIQSDTTGLQAAMYLKELQLRTVKPNRKRSETPVPAKDVKGDSKVSAKMTASKKAYDKAGKTGDIQARIDLKREAKKAGVDVSKW